MSDRVQDLTNHRKVAVACKNYVDNKITELKWELGSHTLDVESDTTTAYTKTVPSGAIGCQINKIGGMSYKTTNVLNLTATSGSKNGVTYTVSDGVITLNGTASTGSFNQSLTLATSIPQGTYTFLPFGTYTNISMYIIDNGVTYETNVGSSTSVTITTDSATGNLYFKSAASGYTYNNYTIKPMLVSGSAAPTEYKPYFEGIRDTAVTSVVSKDSNDTTIDTYTIPSEIQALDGYGRGINENCYNYIDFETKKFVKKVGMVDLGTLAWSYNPAKGAWYSILDDARYVYASDGSIQKLLSTYYQASSKNLWDNASSNTSHIAISNYLGTGNINVIVSNGSSTIRPSGILIYELAEPVETDISEYLDDNSIEVEPNGTLTFNNTYEQDVPSEVDYLIEEVKA